MEPIDAEHARSRTSHTGSGVPQYLSRETPPVDHILEEVAHAAFLDMVSGSQPMALRCFLGDAAL